MDKKKVIICLPTFPFKPHQATLESIKNEVPILESHGWEHGLVSEIGNPYISAARAAMLRKALDAKADVVFFLDSDLSWTAGDLVKVLETEGEVVGGTYRFKQEDEAYMGNLAPGPFGRPLVRDSDGAIKATALPGGFLKVARSAINHFMETYPELCFGEKCSPSVDLFNHGAHKGVWWGEDYAFCRNWTDAGGELWLVPDIDISHNSGPGAASEGKPMAYPGNFHRYMLRQPGGSASTNPQPVVDLFQEAVSKAKLNHEA